MESFVYCKWFKVQVVNYLGCQRLDFIIWFEIKVEIVVVDIRNLVRQNEILVNVFLFIYIFQGYRGGYMFIKIFSFFLSLGCFEFF